MSDGADRSVAIIAQELDLRIAAARLPIPAGVAGFCDQCEEYSPRLVGGRCAPCRDGRARC